MQKRVEGRKLNGRQVGKSKGFVGRYDGMPEVIKGIGHGREIELKYFDKNGLNTHNVFILF